MMLELEPVLMSVLEPVLMEMASVVGSVLMLKEGVDLGFEVSQGQKRWRVWLKMILRKIWSVSWSGGECVEAIPC